MVFCGVFELSLGKSLNCQFKNLFFNEIAGSLYSCDVNNLDTTNYIMNVTGYTGYHSNLESHTDVKAINIFQQNIKLVPINLGILFNLFALRMDNSQLLK